MIHEMFVIIKAPPGSIRKSVCGPGCEAEVRCAGAKEQY